MFMLSIIGGSTLAVLLIVMFFVGYFKAPTNKCFVNKEYVPIKAIPS